MACENLCTAAKCAELEARIEALEAALQAHLAKSIPEAHDYDSNIKVEAFLSGKELGISISDVTSSDTASATIPFCDETTCQEIEKKIDSHLNQSIPEAHDYECDLAIEAFYTGNGIGISLSSCFGNDTASVDLPYCKIEDCSAITNEVNNITNEIVNINKNYFNINNNFNAFFNSFNFTIENITNEYNQINNTITNIETNITNIETNITNVENNITNVENNIITIIENPPEEITTGCGISGFIQGNYLELFLSVGKCTANTSILFPMAEDCCDEILQGIEEIKAVTGSIINQLDFRANLIDDAIDDVEENIEEVKAVAGSLINQLDFRADLIDENVNEVKELVSVPISGEIASGTCIIPLDNDNNPVGSHAVYEPNETGFNYVGTGLEGLHEVLKAMDFKLTSIHESTCEAILLDPPYETVSIVAAPEVQTNVANTLLVLDFTTVAAFPKLNATKSKWRIQIPAPIPNLTWDDLVNIRWYRGAIFGKVILQEYKSPLTGWFKDLAAGESYFNQILDLTQGTVKKIGFNEHTVAQFSPAEIETRVYRGYYITIDSSTGEPINNLTVVLYPPIQP